MKTTKHPTPKTKARRRAPKKAAAGSIAPLAFVRAALPGRYEISGFPGDPLKIQFNTAPEGEPPNGVTVAALQAVLRDHAHAK